MNTKPLIASVLPVLALLLGGCNLNVIRGSGYVVSEARTVSDFTNVELLGSGHVVLTQGNEEALKVEAEDNLLGHLRTEVRGHTLYLGLDDTDRYEVLWPTKPVNYYVSLKSVEGLKLTGSGVIEAQKLQADRLALDITGSGDINIASLTANSLQSTISGSGRYDVGEGTVPQQQIEISGSGSYHGERLAGESVSVRIIGSGDAAVWAENKLEARVSGSGDVRYYGTPQVTQIVTGSGGVEAQGNR